MGASLGTPRVWAAGQCAVSDGGYCWNSVHLVSPACRKGTSEVLRAETALWTNPQSHLQNAWVGHLH